MDGRRLKDVASQVFEGLGLGMGWSSKHLHAFQAFIYLRFNSHVTTIVLSFAIIL